MRSLVLVLLVFAVGSSLSPSRSRAAAAAADVIASPFLSLKPQLLVPRFLDVGPSCANLIGDMEEPQAAKAAAELRTLRSKVRSATRLERSEIRAGFERLARSGGPAPIAICGLLENARIALREGFGPEASSELRRARRLLPEAEWPSGLRELATYLEAESLVALRREGETQAALYLASQSTNADFALAADLRLFELTTRPGIVDISSVATSLADVSDVSESDTGLGPVLPDVAAFPGGPGEARPPEVFSLDVLPLDVLPLEEREREVRPDVAAAPAVRPAYALWKQLDGLLSQARARDFDVSSWSLRAGEHAFLAGRFASAHHWLAVGEGIPAFRRLAAIRKADVLVRLDRRDDARRTLERSARRSPDKAARDLAGVRLVRYSLVTEGAEERLRLLDRAAHSHHPVVASIALDQLALEYLDRGDPDAALAALRKLAYSTPTLAHVPRYTATLDSALAAAVEATAPERDCSAVLGRMATSWELFLRHATRPEPFTAVGECFIEMDMSREALLVYRAIARTMGVESIPDLALRLAEASLGADDLRAARAAIRASLRPMGGDVPLSEDALRNELQIANEQAARWWWLAALLASMEGRESEAQYIGLALLEADSLPSRLRPAIEASVVSRAARQPDDAALVAAVLGGSLRRSVPGSEHERALVRAQLADRAWAEGALGSAGSEYRDVRSDIEIPTPRARAEYRGALAVDTADTARALLRGAAQEEPRNAWSRLSRIELRLMTLRESVGIPSQVRP